MERKVLVALLVIGLVATVAGAGLYALFIDTETSSGNLFESGWLDLKVAHPPTPIIIEETVYLHPDGATDTTLNGETHELTGTELDYLARSDNARYRSWSTWETGYSDDEYIEFRFPDIPSGVTVKSVQLKFEWAKEIGIKTARLRIWNGSSWETHPLAPLPPPSQDYEETVDLVKHGIDTVEEVNALKIWFQAIAPAGAHTRHDLVEVTVTYTVTTIPEPEWSDGVVNTFGMTNMKPGDSASGKILLRKIGPTPASSLTITCNYTVTEEEPQTEADTDPNTDEHPDNMAKAMEITKLKYSGTDRLGNLADADGDGKKTLYDLKYAGLVVEPPNLIAEFEIEITFNPTNANDFQGDTFNLTMIFILKQ